MDDPKNPPPSNVSLLDRNSDNSLTKQELIEVKTKLLSELDKVMKLIDESERTKTSFLDQNCIQQSPSIRQSGLKRRLHQPTLPVSKRSKPKSEIERVESDMIEKCKLILMKLMRPKSAHHFLQPVDVTHLNIPDYFDIIHRPMDLGTIKAKLYNGDYATPVDFASDIRLTFRNAMTYNPEENYVHRIADSLLQKFEKLFQQEYIQYQNALQIAMSENREGSSSKVGQEPLENPSAGKKMMRTEFIEALKENTGYENREGSSSKVGQEPLENPSGGKMMIRTDFLEELKSQDEAGGGGDRSWIYLIRRFSIRFRFWLRNLLQR